MACQALRKVETESSEFLCSPPKLMLFINLTSGKDSLPLPVISGLKRFPLWDAAWSRHSQLELVLRKVEHAARQNPLPEDPSALVEGGELDGVLRAVAHRFTSKEEGPSPRVCVIAWQLK